MLAIFIEVYNLWILENLGNLRPSLGQKLVKSAGDQETGVRCGADHCVLQHPEQQGGHWEHSLSTLFLAASLYISALQKPKQDLCAVPPKGKDACPSHYSSFPCEGNSF